MACPGSAAYAAQLPDSPSSEAAKEGTAAHEAAELVLTGRVGSLEELIDRRMSNGVYVTDEMVERLNTYVSLIPQGAAIEISGEHLGLFNGTPDATWFDETTNQLYVCDLKYGWSIVEPSNNWQLIAYAIIAGGERFATVSLTIVQPRPYHPDGPVRTWTISGEELQHYAAQLRDTLSNLPSTLNSGSHCRYCPALTLCPAAREAAYNSVDVAHSGGALDPEDKSGVAIQLDQLERAAEIIKQRREALEEVAIAKGGVPGWGVEPSIGRRDWSPGLTPDTVAAMTGADITETRLVTPAQAEKRGVPRDIIDTLTYRPQRGMKLKRIAADAAAKAFGNA
jgi:hypothetical protein